MRELLAQHEAEERHGGAFLAAPALLQLPPDVDRHGQRLGPWELTLRLGAGGMGEVWEARRADGAYEARVAVKVLRGGPESPALLEHFAQEQRLLARLNHPHIARLLDAGHTADGHPYFVLEAVQGSRWDAACSALPLAGRLRLFLQLADAVGACAPPPADPPRPEAGQRAGDGRGPGQAAGFRHRAGAGPRAHRHGRRLGPRAR